MNITIKTIPHSRQRYKTVGDWWFESDNGLQIRVSNMHNPYYEILVARHELDEAILCMKHGIKEKEVTEFDLQFEKERKAGRHSDEAEPGDDPRAPYHKEHKTATQAEVQLAIALGIDWSKYEKTIYDL